MERLKLLQTGTVAFQETNLEWHNKSYRDEFQKLLVKAFGSARADYSTTKDKFETSSFKPGGTASAALGKMLHRVVKTGRDDTGCGRWSYIKFNGKENKHITVINTYRVCSQRDPGDTTSSRQQQCIQYANEELRPYALDLHKQTLIDLQYFVQELQQGGDEVILFLDANQDEYQPYRPQDHDAYFKTKGDFQVDCSIDRSLHSFMANCGLTNALTDVHSEQVPNTHVRGSKKIGFALVTDGIRPCIKAVGLLDESILKSNHRAIFLDLDLLLLFGTSLERLKRPQFRILKLDDPRISDSYRKLLHKQFECHNIYNRRQHISEQGKANDWSNEDKRCYEVLDRDITAAMLRAAEKCTIRNQHDTPWAPSLSKATHAIRYWTRRIAKNGIRHINDSILDHFLEHSDVDASYFDKNMTVEDCASELRNAKAKFKDVLDEATSNGDLYEVELATTRVERRYPHLVKDNVMQAQEREERIEKEVKQRETRRATQKSFRKLGYQI
jgi:hypothetical protein